MKLNLNNVSSYVDTPAIFVIGNAEVKKTKDGNNDMLQLDFVNVDNAFTVKEYFLLSHEKKTVVNTSLNRLKELVQLIGMPLEFEVNELVQHQFMALPYKEKEFTRLQLLEYKGKRDIPRMEDVPF